MPSVSCRRPDAGRVPAWACCTNLSRGSCADPERGGEDATLGGAGNVVKNLRSLNVDVMVVGVMGADETGNQILKGLGALGVNGSGLVCDPQRVSTRKIRYVSIEHGQQVFRVDEETAEEVSGEVEENIVRQLRERAQDAQVILCSDYLKGVLTAKVLKVAFEVGRERKVPVIVAPKDSVARNTTEPVF